ncbi:MAG: envelope stress response membrane protein PspB [Wenzhouxiangella sp.]|jgi:phage shock protein B|nr:envelope stress response membrane protein PspB [Wenzhouxiangella sp.]
MSDILFVPLVLFLVIVAPIWLILHYATRNSASRKISSKDEALLEDLHESARRFEDRIHTLERILDADSPEWRNRTS